MCCRPLRRLLPVLRLCCGGVAGLVLAGCQAVLIEEMPPGVETAFEARKAASLRTWKNAMPGRAAVLEEAELRTGLLLGKWQSVDVQSSTSGDTVRTEIRFTGSNGSIGSAAPVTDDGYFLTAAHCVDEGPLTMVTMDSQSQAAVKSTARVVWTGDPQSGLDLALVHIPRRGLRPFSFVSAEALRRGAPVAATGWSGAGGANAYAGTAAGQVLSVSRQKRSSGAAWRVIEHSVPLNGGDSGGPLLTPDGRLAGINSLVTFRLETVAQTPPDQPLSGYSAEAVAPDPAWIQELIAADRARAY